MFPFKIPRTPPLPPPQKGGPLYSSTRGLSGIPCNSNMVCDVPSDSLQIPNNKDVIKHTHTHTHPCGCSFVRTVGHVGAVSSHENPFVYPQAVTHMLLPECPWFWPEFSPPPPPPLFLPNQVIEQQCLCQPQSESVCTDLLS